MFFRFAYNEFDIKKKLINTGSVKYSLSHVIHAYIVCELGSNVYGVNTNSYYKMFKQIADIPTYFFLNFNNSSVSRIKIFKLLHSLGYLFLEKKIKSQQIVPTKIHHRFFLIDPTTSKKLASFYGNAGNHIKKSRKANNSNYLFSFAQGLYNGFLIDSYNRIVIDVYDPPTQYDKEIEIDNFVNNKNLFLDFLEINGEISIKKLLKLPDCDPLEINIKIMSENRNNDKKVDMESDEYKEYGFKVCVELDKLNCVKLLDIASKYRFISIDGYADNNL